MTGRTKGAISVLRRIWRALKTAATPSAGASRAGALVLLLLWLLLGLATVFSAGAVGLTLSRGLGALVSTLALALCSLGLLFAVWLLGALRLPLRAALLLALPPVLLLLIGVWGPWGGLAAAAGLLLFLPLLAGAGAALVRRGVGRTPRLTALGVFGLTAAGAIAVLVALLSPAADPNPALKGYHLRGTTLALEDPGRPGPYAVSRFTYGGGHDRYRPEFAEGARYKTRSVDLSKLDLKWKGLEGWTRTLYWGFDATRLPLQGRVFMPVATAAAPSKGPFPLVLAVHGNHDMEVSSDPGYDYLGALLASQGFIFVEVDENFLNSSLADEVNPFSSRHGEENSARGVILLEHLAQWRAWTTDPKSPLHGAADLTRVGLIGHSRGGEAVALAKAFNDLSHDPDDATVPFHYGFGIRAVAAIAPVDGQYKPRDHALALTDANYFVIHGSMDGDVTSFMGSSEYARARFTGAVKAFKASLYVKDANHGQFNTVWGRTDDGLPSSLLLDTGPILPAEVQRGVAKVYLAAFFRATLEDEDGYRPLFEDARRGAGWLPDDYLVNNYADSATRYIATFEEDLDPATATAPGAVISADNLTVWRERYAKLKNGSLDTHLAVIGWDDRAGRRTAAYAFDLGPRPLPAGPEDALVFSAAAADEDSLPAALRQKVKSAGAEAAPRALDWTVEVSDAHGVRARVPLSADSPLYPQVKGQPRRLAILNAEPSSEIVLRRFSLPLRAFAAANPRLDLRRLREIRFVFDRSSRGVIALDDVGFARLP
jgi:hypothetical protein